MNVYMPLVGKWGCGYANDVKLIFIINSFIVTILTQLNGY